MDIYHAATAQLQKSLISLTTGGRLGETFSQQTDVPMKRDRPVVYDVSSIDDSDTDMQAAILLACWSAGFGTVNIANALADAGLEPAGTTSSSSTSCGGLCASGMAWSIASMRSPDSTGNEASGLP